jgi:uncharacterized small protein (DUF1192 family)
MPFPSFRAKREDRGAHNDDEQKPNAAAYLLTKASFLGSTTVAELTNNRVAVVAAEIARVINTFKSREERLVALAGTAMMGQWTEQEVERGFEAAKPQLGLQENSSVTLLGQVKRACHPHVRPHAAVLAKLAHEAWDAEAKSDSQPCRKAFKRCDHLVVNYLFKEVLENGRIFQKPSEVVAYAIARDPDVDYQKVLKRLRDIQKQWQDFTRDFPVPGADKVNEYFAAIGKNKKHLKAALDKRNQPQSSTDR